MINVYIVSGFLGAGKTTFIQKLLKEKKFEKVMLLENEFGEVGVDESFFDSSLNIKAINNGCICCSLQGDFESALEEIESYGISDLIVEPSGVGKLSEIIKVIANDPDFRIISHICIVDVKTCIKYHKNFGEYFNDQVKSANTIILSHLDVADENKKEKAIAMIKEVNEDALISDKPIDDYSISELLELIVSGGLIVSEEIEHHEHHHHHHEGEEECCCGHHHHDDDEDEDEECCCHHHDDDENDEDEECCCGHHHHHDDETFSNLILCPEHCFTKAELAGILENMDEDIIRVKGWVNSDEGTLYFNYILNEFNIFTGEPKEGALICVIGTVLDREHLKEVFHG